jgi:hypothetical protein
MAMNALCCLAEWNLSILDAFKFRRFHWNQQKSLPMTPWGIDASRESGKPFTVHRAPEKPAAVSWSY